MNHRLRQALIGLLAGLSTIGLLALPASANTADLDITGGTIDFYNVSDELEETLVLGGTGCGGTTLSLTAAGSSSGTLEGTLVRTGAARFFGDDYVMVLAATLTGTYVGSDITLFATAVVALDPSTGSESCTKSSTDDCVVFISAISLAGPTDATLPTFDPDDVASLSSWSTPLSIAVGPGCPPVLGTINNGYILTSSDLALLVL